MSDLMPSDRVRVRRLRSCGKWKDQRGTVVWAGDGHGADRMVDVEFDNPLFPTATFSANEVRQLEREAGVSDTLLSPAGVAGSVRTEGPPQLAMTERVSAQSNAAGL